MEDSRDYDNSMEDSRDYSEFQEDEQPRARKISRRKFNTKLDTNHINVSPSDNSLQAQWIRTMTTGVSEYITPRQLISVIFIVAAYTMVFLTSVIVSDLFFALFELFHHFSDEVNMKLGSSHDVKMRLFSALFSLLGLLVELDKPFVENNVPILKFFIPRSVFLLLIATLSEMNPMIEYEMRSAKRIVYDDDDFNNVFNYNSSGYDRYLEYNNYNENSTDYYPNENYGNFIQDEIPEMIVSLPLVSAAFLKISVWVYFLFGILCLDQLKPNAFVPGDGEQTQKTKAKPPSSPYSKSTGSSPENSQNRIYV